MTGVGWGYCPGASQRETCSKREKISLLQGMHQDFLHPKLPKGARPGALALNTFYYGSLNLRTT